MRLKCVISGCTVMTGGAYQPSPQSPATQSRPADPGTGRGSARRSGADGARLRNLAAAGLPLLAGSASVDRTAGGRRPEDRFYREVVAPLGGAGSFLRQGQTADVKRVGQSRAARVAAAEMRRWRSVPRLDATRSSWNIASTACSLPNSSEFTNCWCRIIAAYSDLHQPVADALGRSS
jgi:hypothetical protein